MIWLAVSLAWLAVIGFIAWRWSDFNSPFRKAERQWLSDFKAANKLLSQAFELQFDASERNDARDLGKAYILAKTARTRILQLSGDRP